MKNRIVRPTNLLRYKEAYIVATAEMEGSHVLPKYSIILSNDLQKVLHSVGKQNIVDEINSKSAIQYARKVVERVNKEEAKAEGPKKYPRAE